MRFKPDNKGNIKISAMPSSSYGHPTNKDLPEFCRRWVVVAPDNSACTIDPEIHHVEEHKDGTISLTPSLVTSSWHGWLKRGIFTSV